MRKLLPILLLAVLFISCSSDDDGSGNGNGNGNSTIDEAILGKWKVEYSKTITPARFDEETGEVSYESNAIIKEYFGNFGEPNISPESSMFGDKDVWIDIKKDNTIDAYHTGYTSTGYTPKTITYKVEDGYLKQTYKNTTETMNHLYYFEGDELIIEKIPHHNNFYYYTISRYSKITE